jgi:hypothetical protein
LPDLSPATLHPFLVVGIGNSSALPFRLDLETIFAVSGLAHKKIISKDSDIDRNLKVKN